MELADGTKTMNVAVKRGGAEVTLKDDGNDLACNSTDYCCKVDGAPQTYAEAMSSPHATEWRKAMEEEMESLKENDTFDLTTLPVSKNPVGGKWVYTIKETQKGLKRLRPDI